MKIPSKKTIEKVRRQYPVGCRVELVKMDDVQAPPIGTKGTVTGVDDTGSILVNWDSGGSLNVLFGVDFVRKLDSVTVVCYGKTEVWDDRQQAAAFYLEGMACSDGSERERYAKIYTEITLGMAFCTDTEDD